MRGPTETQFGRSRRPRDAHARVPFTAASVTAQPNRLDGYVATRRRYIPVQVRCKTREAFQHSRYMRPTTLVNLCRSTRRAGKVEQMSRAIGLMAATHLSFMPSEHPFMLELASSPLTKLPCSPARSIPAFGRLALKWWLLELVGQWQRRQHFGTLQTIGGLRAVGVGSGRACAQTPQPRLSRTAVQALLEAACGPTLHRPHAGCTQGAPMLRGLILACSARSARISRLFVMAWPPCGTRADRRWRDLQRRCVHATWLIESRPTRVCRMCGTGLSML